MKDNTLESSGKMTCSLKGWDNCLPKNTYNTFPCLILKFSQTQYDYRYNMNGLYARYHRSRIWLQGSHAWRHITLYISFNKRRRL